MTLHRLEHVPHVGSATVHGAPGTVVLTLPDGSAVLDLQVSGPVPAGYAMASATLSRSKAIELRDRLKDAIDSMPGEQGD